MRSFHNQQTSDDTECAGFLGKQSRILAISPSAIETYLILPSTGYAEVVAPLRYGKSFFAEALIPVGTLLLTT